VDKFLSIVAKLAGMVDRFTSILDCVNVVFLSDGILDSLPAPGQIGATRVDGSTSADRARIMPWTRCWPLAVAPDDEVHRRRSGGQGPIPDRSD
jgi:hypothetical protein